MQDWRSWLLALGVLLLVVWSVRGADGGQGEARALPRGTILAWVPPEEGAQPPEGWWVCDGETHELHPWVPDLSDRFLLGTALVASSEAGDEIGTFGGSIAHGHPGSRIPLELSSPQRVEQGGVGAREAARSSHRHTVDVAQSRHLPPFYRVVYIIKG